MGDAQKLDAGSSHVVSGGSDCLLPNEQTMKRVIRGTVSMRLDDENGENTVTTSEVDCVAGIAVNILSYMKLERKGVYLVYDRNKIWLKQRDREDRM